MMYIMHAKTVLASLVSVAALMHSRKRSLRRGNMLALPNQIRTAGWLTIR